jgi:hypothetical protein
MALSDRLQLYARLEELRDRPLMVYVTSSRPKASGLMASDAVPQLLDQLTRIPASEKKVDLLVVSQGGDPTVAWRAMSLLRERFDEVAVLIPQAAYSAATLLALGANEIVMHPHGNLGPVDPQVVVKRKPAGADQEVELRFGYEELTGFLQFAKGEAGLSDQQHIGSLLQFVCQEVGAVTVGAAARGSLLSISMGEKLLRMHMPGEGDVAKAKAIAEALNKKFFHHGYPVSRSEAKEIGLKVADSNSQVEDVMWQIWSDIEKELRIRTPFDPGKELANSQAGAILLAPPQQVNLPANLPPQLAQQVLASVLGQIQVAAIPPVEFQLIHAVMESRRHASRFVVEGKILATRMPDLQLKMNLINTSSGWIDIEVPVIAEAQKKKQATSKKKTGE